LSIAAELSTIRNGICCRPGEAPLALTVKPTVCPGGIAVIGSEMGVTVIPAGGMMPTFGVPT